MKILTVFRRLCLQTARFLYSLVAFWSKQALETSVNSHDFLKNSLLNFLKTNIKENFVSSLLKPLLFVLCNRPRYEPSFVFYFLFLFLSQRSNNIFYPLDTGRKLNVLWRSIYVLCPGGQLFIILLTISKYHKTILTK